MTCVFLVQTASVVLF